MLHTVAEMSTTESLKMPDGEMVQTITIDPSTDFDTHLRTFMSDAICNIATPWLLLTLNGLPPENGVPSTSNPDTIRYTNRAKITLLKLCNLNNTCPLIKHPTFNPIPADLINFLALKDVRFVGVDISKDLQKLKEEYAIEIRNAIDLGTVAAFRWGELSSSRAYKSHYHYEVWKDYVLKIHKLPLEKLPVPLFGIRLLSTLLLKMKIPYQPLSPKTMSTLRSHIDLDYLTVPVYPTLRIGIKLLMVTKVKCPSFVKRMMKLKS